MRVALCQLNSKVGDIEGNRARMIAWYREAVDQGTDLVVFPEMALTGYPPRDLLELDDFRTAITTAIPAVAAETGDAGIIFGTPLENPTPGGKRFLNGAVLCVEGSVQERIGKKLLPIYDVFDEARQFEGDDNPAKPISFRGIRLGLHVCEDAWNEEGFWPRLLSSLR